MDIQCIISAPNYEKTNVLLRKFYQVVFVNEDLKKISIYTTTIIGKISENNAFLTSDKKNSNQSEDNDFIDTEFDEKLCIRIRFQAIDRSKKTKSDSLKKTKSDSLKKITHEDMTHDFYKQESVIKTIWGKNSEYIRDIGTKREELERIFGISGENLENCDFSENAYLFLDQHERSNTLYSFSEKGAFFNDNTDNSIFHLKYNISNEEKMNKSKSFHAGEMFHAVKTTIEFKEILDIKDLNFIIKLDDDNGNEYYLPDFTYYLIPPYRYEINKDKTILEYYNNGDFMDNELNPLPEVKKNNVAYFKTWIDKENIESKNVYKLRSSIQKYQKKYFNGKNEIKLNVVLSRIDRKADIHFILGFIISIFLSYGLDSGRIEKVSNRIIFNKTFPSEIIWLFYCAVILWVIYSSRKENQLKKEPWWIKCVRIAILIFFVMWFLLVFVFPESIISTWKLNKIFIIEFITENIFKVWFLNFTITDLIFIIGLILLLVYLILYCIKYKDNYIHIKIVNK